jgi:dihydroorotase
MMIESLTITQPDDWHVHLRDGPAMQSVLPDTAARFARAIIMPNLKPPVTTVAEAAAYRERILAARPAASSFTPLMTLYLTDRTHGDEIIKAKATGFIPAVKYYPAGDQLRFGGHGDAPRLPSIGSYAGRGHVAVAAW